MNLRQGMFYKTETSLTNKLTAEEKFNLVMDDDTLW